MFLPLSSSKKDLLFDSFPKPSMKVYFFNVSMNFLLLINRLLEQIQLKKEVGPHTYNRKGKVYSRWIQWTLNCGQGHAKDKIKFLETVLWNRRINELYLMNFINLLNIFLAFIQETKILHSLALYNAVFWMNNVINLRVFILYNKNKIFLQTSRKIQKDAKKSNQFL